ncbi:MAG: hypothetical protein PHW46_06240, partial [Candidatus Omnitrophica bacterium]|nr:hypothetical protein [Candidatus Omnitrophota bacterium]
LENMKKLREEKINMLLALPSANEPVELEGKVAWQTRQSLEDNASYDVGVEFLLIKERSKNPFLKFLCDVLYSADHKIRT